jgi:hypothetical protein
MIRAGEYRAEHAQCINTYSILPFSVPTTAFPFPSVVWNSLTKHSGPYLLSLEDWFNLWYRPIFGVRRLISSDNSPRYLSFGRRYGGPYLSGQHLSHRSTVK